MAVTAYLNFDGNCRQAVEFYSDAFGTEKPRIMTFGESPSDPSNPLPESAKDRVMHAQLVVEGTTLMFSDTFPGSPYAQGNNISLAVTSTDAATVRRYYDRLKDGGKVIMEPQETFFSKCYGSVTDKFGIQWQVMLGQ